LIFNAKTRRGKGAKGFYFGVHRGIKIQNAIRRFAPFYSLQPDFPPKDAAAEGNLSVIIGKIRLVAGCNFYFLRQKTSYHFQRLGNWNRLIKQQQK
jgi:hypothetical protein